MKVRLHDYRLGQCPSKKCLNCGEEYLPTGHCQSYCTKCRPAMKAIKDKECTLNWRAAHPERVKESRKSYRDIHIEHYRALSKISNPLYYAVHHEEMNKTSKAWARAHPEATRAADAKNRSKRKRGLGFAPLNRPFEGSDAHHLNKDDVIYIPHELHLSIRHNIWTGKNMERINAVALGWAKETEVSNVREG